MRIGKPSHGDSAWMRALIDTVPAPIWSANPSGEPTYINRALATQTGIAIDDLEDENSSVLAAAIANAIHLDDMEMVGAALGRSFSTGEPFRLRMSTRRCLFASESDGLLARQRRSRTTMYRPSGVFSGGVPSGICFPPLARFGRPAGVDQLCLRRLPPAA